LVRFELPPQNRTKKSYLLKTVLFIDRLGLSWPCSFFFCEMMMLQEAAKHVTIHNENEIIERCLAEDSSVLSAHTINIVRTTSILLHYYYLLYLVCPDLPNFRYR